MSEENKDKSKIRLIIILALVAVLVILAVAVGILHLLTVDYRNKTADVTTDKKALEARTESIENGYYSSRLQELTDEKTSLEENLSSAKEIKEELEGKAESISNEINKINSSY